MKYLKLDATTLARDTGTLLVPSRRIAAALVESIEHAAWVAGQRVARIPRVLTVDVWLQQLNAALAQRGSLAALRLLSPAIEHALVASTLPRELRKLAELFVSGWRLVHDYELVAELDRFDDYEDARRFADWAIAHRRDLARRGCVTYPQLPAALSKALSDAERPHFTGPLTFVGFEHYAPSLRRLMDVFATRGTPIRELAFEQESRRSVRIATCSDPADELARALHWAHELVMSGAQDLHIGIVLPDLTARYNAVLRGLGTTFGADGIDAPYNISGGIPLGAVPAIGHALSLLRWCVSPLSSADVAMLLTSPFLDLRAGASLPRTARLPSHYSLHAFASAVPRSRAAELDRQIHSWQTMRQTMSEWLREFARALAIAGWMSGVRSAHRPTLASETFQARTTFDAMVTELSTHAAALPSCGVGDAVETLVSAAMQRPFAPQRSSAPVQVLGYLESVGLRFTHLWVTGLAADSWPARPHVHPFVPRRWQALRGVARSSIQDEVDFARRTLDGWCSAAPEVVLSYHAASADGERTAPSPLLPDCGSFASTIRNASSARSSETVLQPFDDADVPLRVAGLPPLGARALRDQSVCPFRAFAVHRLAIEKKHAPSLLPTADERGTTVHAALHLAYRMLRSRDRLEALGHEARRELAERVVSDALADATQRNAPASYLVTERARLVASVLDWFRVDLARPDFECEATEQSLEAQIAGVPFGIRIDRVDRDASRAQRILIDYKSGTASPLQWRGVRPEEPQVPLYTVVLGGVREAALAEVAPLGSRLNGVAADPERYERGPAIRMAAPTRLDAPTWEDLEERWRTSITSLARELASGVARVDPLHAGICRTCHLHTLCRIDDRYTRFNDGD